MRDTSMLSGSHHKHSNEDSPLIKKASFSKLQQRYRNTRKCVSSKAALLVLLWSFIVYLVFMLLVHSNTPPPYHSHYYLILVSGYGAIIYIFYPLAGHLADTKFGRYKTILTSLWMLLLSLFLGSVGAGVVVSALLTSINHGVYIFLISVGAVVLFSGFMLLMVGIVGFSANRFQFGLDQLYDSPAEDQSLFIHWCMWTYYAAVLTSNVLLNILLIKNQLSTLIYALLGFISFIVISLLIISLCVAYRKRIWFLIEPSRLNPYKLVYKVSKFAHQHKVPVHRSAFTYCEDEVPSGLDLGKDKYGGLFTIGQVEDIKAFYGILKVLFSLGPVFFVDTTTDSIQSLLPSRVQ